MSTTTTESPTKPTGFTKRIPNVFSCVRIAGAFALPFLMWESWGVTITLPLLGTFPGVPLAWIIIFLVLVLTDKADGTLARKLNAESEIGATLDVVGDAALLIIGALCALIVFGRASMTDATFWLNIVIVALIVGGKVLVFFVTLKYFGTGNCLHSWPHKIFATTAYIFVMLWAFLHAVPAWTIWLLLAMMTYAVVDEIIYLVRAATYNVDFRGHGLEKYALRKDQPPA